MKISIDDNVVSGFVYILENPSMPGLLKIGQTQHNPFARAKSLYTTGVPAPFKLIKAWFVKDRISAEKKLHKSFSEFRVMNDKREFFKVDSIYAIRESKRIVEPFLVEEIYSLYEVSSIINKMSDQYEEIRIVCESLKNENVDLKRRLRAAQVINEGVGEYLKVSHECDALKDRCARLDYIVSHLKQYISILGGEHQIWVDSFIKQSSK